MTHLTIDITEQQHRSLEALAASQGKTIGQYAVERLFPAEQGADQPWRELKDALHQRIAAGLAGEVSRQSVDAIVDDELGPDRQG